MGGGWAKRRIAGEPQAGYRTRRQYCHSAVRTIAMTAALRAAGSVGQASTTAAKSGSIRPVCAPSAPHSAPLSSAICEFPDESCDSSSPVPATLKVPRSLGRAAGRIFAQFAFQSAHRVEAIICCGLPVQQSSRCRPQFAAPLDLRGPATGAS